MNRETTIWLALFLLGGAALIFKGAFTESGLGVVHVKPARVDAQQQPPLRHAHALDGAGM